MKLLNMEDGYECLYIQYADIIVLRNYEHDMPELLEYRIKNIDVNDDNSMKFIRFFDKETIDYLNSLYWLYDLRKIKDLSKKDMDFEMDYYIDKSHEILTELRTGVYDMEKYADLLVDLAKVSYLINSICSIAYDDGYIMYPDSLDCEGFKYQSKLDDNIIFKQKLNPNELIVQKRNGLFTSKDSINEEILYEGINAFEQYRLKSDSTFKRLIVDYDLNKEKDTITIKFLEIYLGELHILKEYLKGKIKTKKTNRRILH